MKKLTIVKVGDENFSPTNEDLIKVRDLIENNEIITTDYPVNIETFEYNDLNEFEIEYGAVLTIEESADWENIFLQLKDDPDFTIFTCAQVNIKLKSKQISYCKRCNIQNEYMKFNPDWTCLSCKS